MREKKYLIFVENKNISANNIIFETILFIKNISLKKIILQKKLNLNCDKIQNLILGPNKINKYPQIVSKLKHKFEKKS